MEEKRKGDVLEAGWERSKEDVMGLTIEREKHLAVIKNLEEKMDDN